MDLPAFPHGGPASCGSFFCARPPYGDRQSHLTKSDLFLPSAPCRHEVMSLPTLSIETQLCLFFLPFLFSRIIFPLFCYLSDPIVSLSDPAQTPNSILICITYPLLNSPSSMFTGLQPTAYHLGCHFFPPLAFFSLLSRCLIDSFLYSIDDWPTSHSTFFFPSIFYNSFSFLIWLAFTTRSQLVLDSTCCHFYLIFSHFPFFFSNPFSVQKLYIFQVSFALSSTLHDLPKCLVLHIILLFLACISPPHSLQSAHPRHQSLPPPPPHRSAQHLYLLIRTPTIPHSAFDFLAITRSDGTCDLLNLNFLFCAHLCIYALRISSSFLFLLLVFLSIRCPFPHHFMFLSAPSPIAPVPFRPTPHARMK